MNKDDLLSDEFLKQFKTGEELSSFLKSIQKSANGISIPKYTFSYKDINQLPPRKSNAQDYWGYYNDQPNELFQPIYYAKTSQYEDAF